MSAIAIEVTTAAKVLAQLRGKAAVKDSIRRAGRKVSDYKAREISEWALLYVEYHPALRETAMADARKMILEGLLGKRAQRQLANIESNAQSNTQPLSMGSAVQMSGAK